MAESNIAALLQKLTPIKSGMPATEVLTADRLQAIQDLIVALAEGQNIRDGNNVRTRRGPGFVVINADTRPTANIPPAHPFKAYLTAITTDAGAWTGVKVKVHPGLVFKIEEVGAGETILALDDEFTLANDELVWIEAYFSTAGAITGLSLMSGAGWTTYNALYDTYTGGNAWFHPICRIRDATAEETPDFATEDGTGKKLEQFTHTHLIARQHKNTDDVTIWGLGPWPAGGKASAGSGSSLSVCEEEDAGVITLAANQITFKGKRTIAEEGASANKVDVTIDTIKVYDGASQRAEALKQITFLGAISVTDEAAPVGDAETGDGTISVRVQPEDYVATRRIIFAYDGSDITAEDFEGLGKINGPFSP